MNTRMTARALVLIVIALVLVVPIASKSGGISVNGADEVREDSVTLDQNLVDALAVIGPRFVVEYANTLRFFKLNSVPSTLQTLLIQVRSRIILQAAKANRTVSLVYPVALFNDTTPPEISDVVVGALTDTSVTISWITDEFATSVVLYGTQSGTYPEVVSCPLFAKRHDVTVTGLVPGTLYYYKVQGTDQSGNTAVSAERTFTAQISIYLPLIARNY